jgi:hypothetical protein
MTWHLAAYSESAAAAAALDPVAALADPMLQRRNNNYVLPRDAEIPWAWIGSANVTRARLAAPSWRQFTLPELRPYDQTATPSDDPNVCDMRMRPLMARGQEEIELQMTNDAGAAVRVTGLIAFSFGLQPAPAGPSYNLRASSTTAAVANAWTLLTLAFDDDLPNGEYAVIGLEHQSANGQGARLIFDQGFWRPGVPSITDLGNRPWGPAVSGELGVFGRFRNFQEPQVEVLCNAADAAHEVYLRVVRVG